MDSNVKINSFENYCQYMFHQRKIDENPMEDAALDWPDRFSIWNPEGKVVLHGRVQAWDIWGGDYPYNDAFSYEFYFEENKVVSYCIPGVSIVSGSIYSECCLFLLWQSGYKDHRVLRDQKICGGSLSEYEFGGVRNRLQL